MCLIKQYLGLALPTHARIAGFSILMSTSVFMKKCCQAPRLTPPMHSSFACSDYEPPRPYKPAEADLSWVV